ncbi:transposase [Streptomyces sp. NPDC101150]|uniref:transposase n=1 Tax=Streptomyces sp. NPDC101150 TaxID=3366114 RepID=UPI00381CA77A
MSLVHPGVLRGAFGEVSRFRTELYACLTTRGDALFELCDALLCTDGPVRTLVDLALAPEHRRGHGALYGGLNQGRIDVARLRRAVAGLPLPRAADGRLVLAVDVSPWLRPDASTCPDRAFCHTYGRGEGKHQMVPGWPYSVVAALETGRTSWTAVLDAVRLEPGADVAAVTTAQIREVIERLVAAGQWQPGDPKILVVLDAGYDAPRIEGTVIRLVVETLPSRGVNKPVWLWWSGTGATANDVDRCWQSFLRGFDVEHTFRLFKQTLGWTKPRLRSPEAADRWTWLVIAAYAQLRLARPLATDLRRPWEKPAPPNKLTPARVRRGFRNLRVKTGSPAGAPKPSRPGPGRPPGSKNHRPATRHDVGRVLATGEAHSRPTHHKVGTKPRRTG